MIGLGIGSLSLAVRKNCHGIDCFNPQPLFDPSDKRTLFQDGLGTAPVTGPGQPVGLMLDRSSGLTRGQNVVMNGDFRDGANNWNTIGGVTINDGEARIYSPDGSHTEIRQTDILTVGKWYRIEYTVTAYGFGGLSIGLEQGDLSLPVTLGQHSVFVRASVKNLSIRQASGPTDVTITRLSAREVFGHHAAKPVNGDKRPKLARHPTSGVRNLLDASEDWSANVGGAGITVEANASSDPDGSMAFSVLYNSTNINDRIIKRAAVTAENGKTYTASVVLNTSDCTSSKWSLALGKGSEHRVILEFDPVLLPASFIAKDSSNGTIWKSVSYGFEDLGNGFARISITGKAVSLTSNLLEVALWNNDVVAGKKVSVGRTQIETGSGVTAYQTRVDQYDITESGQRDLWYLSRDQGDDDLIVSLADPGSDATEFWMDEDGSTITSGQTIGAGDRVLPGGARLYTHGIINRALTTSEEAGLTKFLKRKLATE
ncbi:phage head spike fiber domain-containing protein [Ruegeria arenilitoris]|uniref:phage head spike fiber domain-containing protein n=1 Tax=Ruegeria arenilitoris TaxID=1173585 RepID=UPI00147F76D1|nr:hypothetical protein [Ruegeria arenilitoris]